MAVFTSSVFAMRKAMILEALQREQAFSPETAVTMEEAGIVNIENFREYTESLVNQEVIRRTGDGRFYRDRDE